MKRYKLIGLTRQAERYLEEDDYNSLSDMIGSEFTECDYKSDVDGKSLFIAPDGEEVHIDFIEIEEIQPKLF